MHLVRLVYYSENRMDSAQGSKLDALKAVLEVSKRNNARQGVTGALVFDDMWFYQALEGDRDAVWAAFTRIMDDPRHGDIVLVDFSEIETRLFGQWAMRLATRNAVTQPLFERFTVSGVVRPKLMNGAEMLEILVGTTGSSQRPTTRSVAA